MKTSNTEQALWLGLGSLSSFLLTILSSVILMRRFDIIEYGTYKQVLYVYQTLLIVFTLGIPKAYSYFLPRIPINQAKSLIKKIRNILFLLGITFSVLLFSTSNIIANLLNNQDLGYALKLFSPVPLLMLPTIGLESILASYQKTQYAAIYTVLTRLLMLAFIIVPVILFKGGYEIAIIGFVAASFLSFILANYLQFKPVNNILEHKCDLSYKEIVKYSWPLFTASVWGMVIGASDQFFISRFFGTEVFAHFSNGSIDLPFVAMAVSATATIITPHFSKLVFSNDINLKSQILNLWSSVLEKNIKIIYPLIFYFIFFANDIIIWLFGENSIDSVIFFRIKTLGNFFQIISYVGLIMAINANLFYSRVHLFHAIILIVFHWLSVIFFNDPYFISLISVGLRILNTMLMVFYILRYFNYSFRDMFPLKLIFKISIASIVILISLKYFVFNLLNLPILFKIVLSFLVYSFTFLIVSFLFKFDYINIFLPLIEKIKANRNN